VHPILLSVARLLRQLLIDNDCLLHRVNRGRQLKISFEVNAYAVPMPTDFDVWDIHDCFEPIWDDLSKGCPGPFLILMHRSATCSYQYPKRERESVNLDGLLAKPKVVSQQETFTVKEIIKYLANTEGGVHRGVPKSKHEKALAHYIDSMAVYGARTPATRCLPMAVRSVKSIGRVVCRALQPIREQVAKEVASLSPAYQPIATFSIPEIPRDSATRKDSDQSEDLGSCEQPLVATTALVDLGPLLEKVRDGEAAKAAYLRALDSGPTTVVPTAAYNLAAVLLREGNPSSAKPVYQRAMAFADSEAAPKAAYDLGTILQAENDVAGAIRAYQFAIESKHMAVAPVAKRAMQTLREVMENVESAPPT